MGMDHKGSEIDGVLGVAPTPGSAYVYDRESDKLVRCNKELCGEHGVYSKDYGWLNHAPYAAIGGISGSISNNASPEMALETSKFFSYVSTLPEPVAADQHRQPFRQSQLDAAAYEELGFSQNTTAQYFETVSDSLESENVVMDIRFSGAPDINTLYNDEVTNYLEQLSENDGSASRSSVVNDITEKSNEIINNQSSPDEYKKSLNYEPPIVYIPATAKPTEIKVEEPKTPLVSGVDFKSVDQQIIVTCVTVFCVFALMFFLYVAKVKRHV